MGALNQRAAEALAGAGVHAATDVTGFGLAGHAAEMARASGVTVRLEAERVPLLDGALDMRRRGFTTRAPGTNRDYAHWRVEGAHDDALLDLLVDPQTSGGLLVAVGPSSDAAARLEAAGCLAARVGTVIPRADADVLVA
jgi:selenide,water dikinase